MFDLDLILDLQKAQRIDIYERRYRDFLINVLLWIKATLEVNDTIGSEFEILSDEQIRHILTTRFFKQNIYYGYLLNRLGVPVDESDIQKSWLNAENRYRQYIVAE